MKKFFAVILAIVYFTSSVGATVHLHYCMDKLVNRSLSGKDGNKCDNCGMEKNGGCCKDEKQLVKSSIDQQFSGSVVELPAFSETVNPPDLITGSEYYNSPSIEEYPVSHAPPIDRGRDILIDNCIFRI